MQDKDEGSQRTDMTISTKLVWKPTNHMWPSQSQALTPSSSITRL